MNAPNTASAQQPSNPAKAKPKNKQTPAHYRLYACFNRWTKNPEQDGHYIALRVAMKEHEMKVRLQRVLSPIIPE